MPASSALPPASAFLASTPWQSFRPLLFVVGILSALIICFPSNIFAIHAIIEDGEPVPRNYEAVTLGMSLDTFLATTSGTKVPPVVGQFEDEHRYQLSPPSSPEILSIVYDFYRGLLFRIDINYRPLKTGTEIIQKKIDAWTGRFGEPRINNFPEVLLVFWDDGATRMILQSDVSEGMTTYSVTYLDDDLFHLISRERVQRETAGRSHYGKKK